MRRRGAARPRQEGLERRQVALADRTSPGRPQVLDLVGELAERLGAFGTTDARYVPSGPACVVAGVGSARITRQVRLGLELLPGVFLDRFEHLEARRPVVAVELAQEALVGERDEAVDGIDVGQADRQVGDDGLDRLDVGAGEAGQDGEEPLLRRRQQLVAPVDRGPQRLLPLGQVARATAQGAQATPQPLAEGLEREDAQAGHGQLDRQRQALEAPTDVGHEGRVVVGDPEVRLAPPRARSTKRRTASNRSSCPAEAALRRRRQAQRRHDEEVLAAHAEGLAARDEQRQLGAAREQLEQRRAPPIVTCSTLSRMRSSCSGASRPMSSPSWACSLASLKPSSRAIGVSTVVVSRGRREVHEGRTRPGSEARRRARRAAASLVLPMPPGPVRVRRRMARSPQALDDLGALGIPPHERGRLLGQRRRCARRAVVSGRNVDGIDG